ncbi:hypothetical protein [Polyangium sp. y55x31]|uniref:hypothetical protein n=1 Tax=Polyangium sp. y55x31 TaxID=3042688 RepID=UPI00248273C5|nr:hypothetical protein [Polyangium sp. y55x31]MDI1484839.1 hypothetical protein [Polyangium sp. y55x31]
MSGKRGEVQPGVGAWVPLDRAAAHLGMNVGALRKTLERRAMRAADGGTEASVDGVRARKFGRIWRVRFSEAWGVP